MIQLSDANEPFDSIELSNSIKISDKVELHAAELSDVIVVC